MLVHLAISDFAIIKQLEIDFKAGLNIVSGETGAGKTILINALNLILGSRASSDLIRSGSHQADVTALFQLGESQAIRVRLARLGIPFDGELLIRRTVSREGRSRVRINGSLATLQWLTQLSPFLISISGQHEHQLLLNPDSHLPLLDDFADLGPRREVFADRFRQWQSLQEETQRLTAQIRTAEERRELERFQIDEIDRTAVVAGEGAGLEEERNRLRHAEELLAMAEEGYQSLYEQSESAFSQVAQCNKRLQRGAEMDSRLAGVREILTEIEARLEDAAFVLRDFHHSLSLDPGRLEELEQRLLVLNRLKRKYGGSLEAVLQTRAQLAEGVQDLDRSRQMLAELNDRREKLETALWNEARGLSRDRRAAAVRLSAAVERELRQLNMPRTRFAVDFEGRAGESVPTDAVLRADGLDRVALMISPNVGEAPRPLAKVASGGELSRIMLAVKTILARRGAVETVVFDEVDAGIGGATAEVVGEKLRALAGFHQVICITHLPQIASQGESHFLVRKEVRTGRTETGIAELAAEQRVQEVARLLGGRKITASALAHAREMVAAAGRQDT